MHGLVKHCARSAVLITPLYANMYLPSDTLSEHKLPFAICTTSSMLTSCMLLTNHCFGLCWVVEHRRLPGNLYDSGGHDGTAFQHLYSGSRPSFKQLHSCYAHHAKCKTTLLMPTSENSKLGITFLYLHIMPTLYHVPHHTIMKLRCST